MNRSEIGKKARLCLAALFILVPGGCASIEEVAKVPEVSTGAVVRPAEPVVDDHLKEVLVGKWKRHGEGGDTIEFKEDGTVVFFSAIEKTAHPGTYRVMDDKQVSTTMNQGEPIIWGYSVTRNELSLKAPAGLVLKYRRIQ